jgi:hypothetical protein
MVSKNCPKYVNSLVTLVKIVLLDFSYKILFQIQMTTGIRLLTKVLFSCHGNGTFFIYLGYQDNVPNLFKSQLRSLHPKNISLLLCTYVLPKYLHCLKIPSNPKQSSQKGKPIFFVNLNFYSRSFKTYKIYPF